MKRRYGLPEVGQVYESDPPNPALVREVVAVLPDPRDPGRLYHVIYRDADGDDRRIWCSSWESWLYRVKAKLRSTPEAAEKGIADVLEAIFDTIRRQQSDDLAKVGDAPAIERARTAIRDRDVYAFDAHLLIPLDHVVEGVLRESFDTPEALFIFKNSGFVENHFSSWIVRFEGHAYHVDKARTIIRKLLDFYLDGTEISFAPPESGYSYHLPKKVFATQEEVLGFFLALRHLHVGRPEFYIQAVVDLTQRHTWEGGRAA